MKPAPRDHRHRLKIDGDELLELKRHIGSMAESFGLDSKIEKYKGTRPLTLYRWDLDCLLDVIAFALKDEREYPDKSSPAYLALKALGERLGTEYDSVYGREYLRASPAPATGQGTALSGMKTPPGTPIFGAAAIFSNGLSSESLALSRGQAGQQFLALQRGWPRERRA